MRDYLAALRERVVVFDGSMGATLEQYDLSQADYGGLQGKCHEALVLHRPDVIQALHESMIEAGAEVVQTDSFQASRLKLEEWGLGEHTHFSTISLWDSEEAIEAFSGSADRTARLEPRDEEFLVDSVAEAEHHVVAIGL